METTTDTPRAWVGCLACYNAGSLVGEWVDGIDAENFTPCPRAGHEEWWCMDHEGYDGLLDGECSPTTATQLATLIEAIEADHYPVSAVAAWADNDGIDLSDWADHSEDFHEAYNGEWESEEEFAQNLADDIGAIDSDAGWPNSYIDWERATRDLFMDYWSAPAPSGVYVFRSC